MILVFEIGVSLPNMIGRWFGQMRRLAAERATHQVDDSLINFNYQTIFNSQTVIFSTFLLTVEIMIDFSQ